MEPLPTRRQALLGAAAISLLGLPGCTTLGDLGGFGFEASLRRLLTVSSQRAFANLLTDNGFFSDDLARVPLPPQLAETGSIISALLRTASVQSQLLRVMNRAAAEAAESAAPIVYDAIRNVTISDATALARGGPTAATDFLQRAMGTAIVDAMFPGVGNALRLFDSGIVNQVAQAATGIDFAGLQQHVTRAAAAGIYRAIGREEASIRANPRSVNDPMIAALFDSGIVNQVAQAATGVDFAGLQQHVTRAAAAGIYRAIGREEASIRANPRSVNDPMIAALFGLR